MVVEAVAVAEGEGLISRVEEVLVGESAVVEGAGSVEVEALVVVVAAEKQVGRVGRVEEVAVEGESEAGLGCLGAAEVALGVLIAEGRRSAVVVVVVMEALEVVAH